MRKIDLTGNIYGRLTVITDDGSRTKSGRVIWLCECSCGNKVHVQSQNLKDGRTKSCGCLNDDKRRERFKDLSEPKRITSRLLIEHILKISECGGTASANIVVRA